MSRNLMTLFTEAKNASKMADGAGKNLNAGPFAFISQAISQRIELQIPRGERECDSGDGNSNRKDVS